MITKENWPKVFSQKSYDCHIRAAGETVDGEQMVVVHSWNDVFPAVKDVAELLGGKAIKTDPYHILIQIDGGGDDELKKHLSGLEDGKEKLLSPKMVEDLVDCVRWSGDLAQWQDDRVFKILFDAEIGFSDEYDTCCDCMKILHYGSEHYGDVGRFFLDPETAEYTCRDCFTQHPQNILHICEESDEPVNCPVDARAHGYAAIGGDDDRFESGLHGGQIDNPTKQKKFLHKCGIRAVLFEFSPSQFDCSWAVLVPSAERDYAEKLLLADTNSIYFWEYEDSVIVLVPDEANKKATVHLHWKDIEEPDEQIECTRCTILERNTEDTLFWLLREAYMECTFEDDKNEWFLELLNNGRGKLKPFSRDTQHKVDPKKELHEGLLAAARLAAAPAVPGTVRAITVANGTATARNVTPEEFINGKSFSP
jgi:hypothetical protein